MSLRLLSCLRVDRQVLMMIPMIMENAHRHSVCVCARLHSLVGRLIVTKIAEHPNATPNSVLYTTGRTRSRENFHQPIRIPAARQVADRQIIQKCMQIAASENVWCVLSKADACNSTEQRPARRSVLARRPNAINMCVSGLNAPFLNQLCACALVHKH